MGFNEFSIIAALIGRCIVLLALTEGETSNNAPPRM
jgi:hypothetical protein